MEKLIFLSKDQRANVFNGIGFKVYIFDTDDEITSFLHRLDKNVIIIGYDSRISLIVNNYKSQRNSTIPLYLELPLDSEMVGHKLDEVKESIKKSIGIDLL